MSDGVVVVTGVFQPGSVVTLTRVASEAVFRAEGGEEIGRRLVDEDGNVGWDGLAIGDYFIAAGYVNGTYVWTRAVATDVTQPSNDLNQAPEPAKPVSIGTQEAPPPVEVPVAPAVPEGGTPLEVGLPEGVSTAQVGAVTYFIHHGDGAAVDASQFAPAGLQAPAFVAADGGDGVPAEKLYKYVGGALDGPDLSSGEWEAYEGPTEPEGTSADASAFTEAPAADPAPVEASSGPVASTTPEAGAGTATASSGEAESAPAQAPVEPQSDPAPTDGAPAPTDPAVTEPEAPAATAAVEPAAAADATASDPAVGPSGVPSPDTAPQDATAEPAAAATAADAAGSQPGEGSPAPAESDAAPAAPADGAPAPDAAAAPADPAPTDAPPAQEGA